MSQRHQRIELAAQDAIAGGQDYYEGGDDNRQLNYFKKEGQKKYFSTTKTRENVGQADIGQIKELQIKEVAEDENAEEGADASAGQQEVAGRSFMVFDEKLDDSKDMRPLNQLKVLSERYSGSHPVDMFQQNHMEQLRKYVDKSEEFTGEIVFYEDHAFVMKPENQIASEGTSYMNIKSVKLSTQLDLLASDVDEESHDASNITKTGQFKYFTVESLKSQNLSPPRSPKKAAAKEVDAPALSARFLELMNVFESQRRVELLQNGRQCYFWTTNMKQRAGKDFSQADKTYFDLVEVDLGSGTTQTIKEHSIQANDKEGWIPLSVGFAKRHSQKEFPWIDDSVKKDAFIKQLKSEVVVVREGKFWHGVDCMRVTLRCLSNYDKVLFTLFEGAFDHKMHFVTQMNSEDVLRLHQKAVVNKLQVSSYEKLAKPVGYLYLTEDSNSKGFYNLVEPNMDDSGKITGFSKYADTSAFSATSLESFKLRVINSNYKYLYDEKKQHFFLRKTVPVYPGAAVISDLILNKMIFMEVNGDNTRLKVTQMKNHGLSFQKLPCSELSKFAHYPNLKEEQLSISSFVATSIVRFDHKVGQQMIISRTTKNMIRCEDTILHMGDDLNTTTYDDSSLKVKSLSLLNSDYISSADLRQKIDKMRSSKTSQLTLIQSSDWQTKDRKPFLQIGQKKHLFMKYKRLISSTGEYLLPRVTSAHVFDPNTNQMVSPSEPRIELFSFKVQGAIPSDEESEVIGSDQAWRVVNERVKFENDDSVQRPLIFSQIVKDGDGNFTREHFWFTIYDFKAEQIVSQVHMNFPDLIIEYQIESVDVAACSEVTQIDENCYAQRFQVSFYLKHQLRAKIIEYTVKWDYLDGRKVTITHTCSKELILKLPELQDTSVENLDAGLQPITSRLAKVQKPNLDDQPVYLIPYMDNCNVICGTQFVYGGTDGARVFILDNKKEESAIKNSKIPFVTDEGYKIYKNETYGQYTAILAYSKLSPAMLSDSILNGQEKAEIIEDAVKAILNSVVFDPSMAMPWQLKRADFQQEFLKQIDLGRGVEVLEWFSIVSLKCDSNDLEQIFQDCHREYEDKAYDVERYSNPAWWPLCSLMERVLINDLITESENSNIIMEGQKYDYDRVKTLACDQFYIKGHEIIQRDIFLNHPLHYLFDLEKETEPKDYFVDLIMKFTFSDHNNCHLSNHMEAQEHLMSMLADILEREQPQKTYFDRFLAQKTLPDPTSNKSQTLQLNVCQNIQVPALPRNQGKQLQAFTYLHETHEFRQNSNYTVDQFLQKTNPLDDGQEHTVECMFFDMRFYNFEQKVKHIKAHSDPNGEIMSSCYNERIMPEFEYTTYELSNMILDIIEKTDGDIRKQKVIRHIIDYQYQDTRKVNLWMLIGYSVGFFIPFFIQMYLFIEPVVLVCNGMCMFTSLLLMRFEIEQLKIQGCSYFASFMNWIDLLGFFSYSFYFSLRISDPSLEMPDYKQNFTEDCLTLLSFPLIMYTSQKLLFYFKMFEAFGLFQSLVSATLSDIKVFLPFMFFWIFIFTTMLRSIGVTYPDGDYPDLNIYVANLIQTWRNSLANVAVPDYSKWSENLRAEEKDESYGLYSYLMIFLSWTIWYLNLLFICLILTNFLISIVGNAYGLIEQDVELIYALKSDLNQEVGLFNKWMKRMKAMDAIIIVAEQEEQEDADANIKDIAASLQDQAKAVKSARNKI